MKSKVQFQLTGADNSNSLTPVIRLEVSRSEDARDFIAKAFTKGFGCNHNLLQWERVHTDATLPEKEGPASFDSTYDIKPFHPEKNLVILDVSGIGNLSDALLKDSMQEDFLMQLENLCNKFDIFISDGITPSIEAKKFKDETIE